MREEGKSELEGKGEKESKSVSSKVDIVIVMPRERIKSTEKIPGPATMLLHAARVLLLCRGKSIRLVFRRSWV